MPAHTSVSEAAGELVAGMTSGRVRTRSGDVYKPSAVRSYEAALRDHVVPRLGATRLADVQRRDVRRIADDLLAQGRDPSTNPQRPDAAPPDLSRTATSQ